MTEYLTIEWETMGGISLNKARRMTEADIARHKIRPEYIERMFIGTGDTVQLPHLNAWDTPKRPADGEFMGCGNRAWIVTQDEWEAYIRLNAERQAEKERRLDAEYREAYLHIIARAERQGGAMTDEEAARARQRYINTYNEGGEGYVPYYITRKDVEAAKAWLKAHPEEHSNDQH